MQTTTFLPATLPLADPRLDMDENALVLASRNGFPIVASRVQRKDGLGLAAGAAGAILLGGATLWSMSSHRTVEPPAPVVSAPVPSPMAPASRALPMPVAPPMTPPAPLAAPAPAAAATPVTGTAPVLVMDASEPIASADTAPRTVASAAGAPKPTVQQPLSENEAFTARIGDSAVDTASATRMVDPTNTITQGTLIAAVLETAIDSDLPGYVRAMVTQDVRSFDGTRILIPRSSRLIGQYKSGLAAGQTRAYVMWSRLIRPDGVSVALASPATDFAGRSGLGGQVDGHFMKRFGSAMLLSVVGAAGAVASSGASLVLSTSGQSAASVAAQRDAQIPPTIRVRQGQPIRIFTARDLDFASVAQEAAQ